MTAAPAVEPALRLLSLGAGVQSSTVLLLACDGVIPSFDYALFADTGWEPKAVYETLSRLSERAAEAGIPVRRVSAGNIRTDALNGTRRFVSMPMHVRNPDGSRGLARRQCTNEYKIEPLKRAARELLGYPHPRRVPAGVYAEQAIGISTDEFHRAKDSRVNYLRNTFPLIDLGWTRTDCERYLAQHGSRRPSNPPASAAPSPETNAGAGSVTTTPPDGRKPSNSTDHSGTATHTPPTPGSAFAASTTSTAPAHRWISPTSTHPPGSAAASSSPTSPTQMDVHRGRADPAIQQAPNRPMPNGRRRERPARGSVVSPSPQPSGRPPPAMSPNPSPR
jgi:hypothetical protein